MGLDMYMFKTKKTSHSVKELCDLDNDAKEDNPALVEFLPLHKPFPDHFPDHLSILTQVAYWRKFNALHNWFVNHVQLGIDDCGMYEVTKDHIEDLLDTLMNAKQDQDPSHFEPVGGFFFGSIEVDEYYWEQVENTSDKMYRLLNDFDWDNERLFYRSSW